MNKKKFDDAYDKLSKKQKQVLRMLLNGNSDETIAKSSSRKIATGTVRTHISNICNIFEIKESSGSSAEQKKTYRRTKLITLVAKYRSNLIQSNLIQSSETDLAQESRISLASDFYIERPKLEKQCYETIREPGSLLRLKAPQQMGKTMLLNRVLTGVEQEGYRLINLEFECLDFGGLKNKTTISDDESLKRDYNQFLKSFCSIISEELKLENKVDTHWESSSTAQYKTITYFEKYILQEKTSPLVLVLENVDLIFETPTKTANDFCRLLRVYNDKPRSSVKANTREIWQKLRLVIVHSTDVYRSLDINYSPLFGVGVTVDLPEFSLEQVQKSVELYGLNWGKEQVEELMKLVGGHPYLLQIALREIKNNNVPFSVFLKAASTEEGIYRNHLGELLKNLEENPKLKIAFKKIVQSSKSIALHDSKLNFKLESMGLVKLKGDEVVPRCDLYRQYFQEHLIDDDTETKGNK